MGKAKKIIAGVLVVAVAGTGIGAGLMQLRKNSQTRSGSYSCKRTASGILSAEYESGRADGFQCHTDRYR